MPDGPISGSRLYFGHFWEPSISIVSLILIDGDNQETKQLEIAIDRRFERNDNDGSPIERVWCSWQLTRNPVAA